MALFVKRHADDVADVGRRLVGRAEVEVFEDPPDRQRVGDVGHQLERAKTASTDERVRLKHLGDEPRPAWRRAALLRLLRLVRVAHRLLVRPLAADAIGFMREWNSTAFWPSR